MDDGKTPTEQDGTTQPQTTEPSTQFTQTDTYVTPTQEPVAAAPVVTPEKKKPSRAGKWLLWGFVVLLLASLAAFAYGQYVEAENAKNENASLQNSLKAAQDANTVDEATETEGDGATLTDKQLIINVAKADAQSPVAAKDSKVTVIVKKQGNEFAEALVGDAISGGGYAVILKKVNEEWVIVFKGQDTPDQTTIKTYGIPAEYYSAD